MCCVPYFIFIGNYSKAVNDAKVAIELQPHFQKAFCRGKSQSLCTDTDQESD